MLELELSGVHTLQKREYCLLQAIVCSLLKLDILLSQFTSVELPIRRSNM